MEIPDLLEGEKADAQGDKGRLHRAAGEEAGVLENAQNHNVVADSRQENAFSAVLPETVRRQQADGGGDQQQPAAPPGGGGAAPQVKHQAGRQQRPGPALFAQQAAGANGDGQKGQKGQRLYVHPFRSAWFSRFS